MSKTDPRIIKTLRQIDSALLENLKTQEFQKITIDMLCQVALINRSTFYKYYRDKHDLLNRYLGRILDEFKAAFDSTDFILATPSSVGEQRYADNFRRSMDFLYANRETYRILWNASIGRNIYDEMVTIVQQNILTTLRASISTAESSKLYQDLYSRLFAANMMELVCWWIQNDQQVSADDVLRLMTSNMTNGLFTTFKSLM